MGTMNMPRKRWLELGPSLLVGAGIVASTCVASLTVASGWLVLAGPLLLAIAFVGAVMLDSRTSGRSPNVYAAALLLGVSFVLASVILFLRGGDHVVEFIPIIGAAGWATLLPRRGNRRASCMGI
jgi:hypothetical protein